MIGPISEKNRLTFGGNMVPDTDSRSLFHFAQQKIISISHTATGRFSRNSAKLLTLTKKWINYILGEIRRTPGSGNPDSNSGPILVKATKVQWVMCTWRWRRYALSECSL